jgi:hypothetical protein
MLLEVRPPFLFHLADADRPGLADALRSEMILHNISIHLFMPAGIDTPGFVEEEKEKPKVTKQIEEDDTQISPEACAQALVTGKLTHVSVLVVRGYKLRFRH